MDAILLQLLNGLDKGGAYALIALGLTLIFGTLGVVNFAHGALFMLGAFCAVTLHKLLTISQAGEGRERHLLRLVQGSAVPEDLVRRRRRAADRLLGAAVDPARHPGDAADRRRARARPDPPLLPAPACRPDPGHLRAGDRAAGDRQGLLRRQPDSDAGARRSSPAAPTSAPGSAWATRISYPWWRLVYFLFSLRRDRRGVRLPALHHLRHGGARRHARPRDGGPVRHRHRAPLHDRVRHRGGRRRARRRDVHADPVARLPHGHGVPGAVVRRRGRRRHGLARRRGGGRASCSASCSRSPR